eukprot:TRINITY_DN43105_c0_g1_i3.p1 TRINITY_DN43105_c0_g1~~TRINITY_DN43105_c0_g1_i3.p1  ORF type:complete len:390 (+),score=73.34 TRINITY_DN43105_c0_g1_i3:65-1171(+)
MPVFSQQFTPASSEHQPCMTQQPQQHQRACCKVLPLIFPGMFSVRDRRFYFFNFDISDGALGKRLRADAKMLIRMTLCIVLSYLWQHCVLVTTTQVGTEFPTKQCAETADCFASELHFLTLVNRQHDYINCDGPHDDFPERVVVSCIRFIPPSATTWLMHLAIAHSVWQLNFKSFELFVWIAGNSKRVHRAVGFISAASFVTFIGLFFGEVMSEFVSSWLSFVMSLSIPLFLYLTYSSAKALQFLWKEESMKVQLTIEEHLNSAFVDIESEVQRANPDGQPRLGGAHRERSSSEDFMMPGQQRKRTRSQIIADATAGGVRSFFAKLRGGGTSPEGGASASASPTGAALHLQVDGPASEDEHAETTKSR